MNLEQRRLLPVPRATLWEFLMNVPEMARCVPGVESVSAAGPDTYAGEMRVRMGPIALRLQGTMRIEARDAAEGRAAMSAEARDPRLGGGLRTAAEMILSAAGPEQTELLIHADVRLLGKLGEFGQPLIRKQADAMMAEFARNVAERLAPRSTS